MRVARARGFARRRHTNARVQQDAAALTTAVRFPFARLPPTPAKPAGEAGD
jgi:hypothetical protein